LLHILGFSWRRLFQIRDVCIKFDWFGSWCLTPLSTLFQLYRGGQLWCLRFYPRYIMTSLVYSNIETIEHLLFECIRENKEPTFSLPRQYQPSIAGLRNPLNIVSHIMWQEQHVDKQSIIWRGKCRETKSKFDVLTGLIVIIYMYM